MPHAFNSNAPCSIGAPHFGQFISAEEECGESILPAQYMHTHENDQPQYQRCQPQG
jgi:hypothetical protein